MPQKSFNSATNLLQRIYADQNDDTLASSAMFRVLKKNPELKNDQAFIATQVSLLRSYNLVSPNYDTGNGARRRVSVTLTEEGKKALSGNQDTPASQTIARQDDTVTLPQIESLVRRWEIQNEGWTIPVDPQRKESQ